MGKIKIYEIAKKLDLTSKEVLEMAQKLNIQVKSHMSSVEEEEAKKIENNLTNKTEQTSKQQQASKKEDKTAKQNVTQKKEEKAPVIIVNRKEKSISWIQGFTSITRHIICSSLQMRSRYLRRLTMSTWI